MWLNGCGDGMYQFVQENPMAAGIILGFLVAYAVLDAVRIVIWYMDAEKERKNKKKGSGAHE